MSLRILGCRFLLHWRHLPCKALSVQTITANQLWTSQNIQLSNGEFGLKTLINLKANLPTRSLQRFKSKKGGSQKKQEDSDEEDSDDEGNEADDEIIGHGFTDSKINVNSLRLDTVMKTASSFGRASVESAFFEGRIRVNGDRTTKKSEEIRETDEIDYIIGRNAANNDLLDITRVEIRNVPDIASGSGRYTVSVRVFRLLTIENYADPYTGQLINLPKDSTRRYVKDP